MSSLTAELVGLTATLVLQQRDSDLIGRPLPYLVPFELQLFVIAKILNLASAAGS